MIQEIEPSRMDNVYDPKRRPEKGDALVLYKDRAVAVRIEDGEIQFPETESEQTGLQFLFSLDGQGFFLDRSEEQKQLPEGYFFTSVPDLRMKNLQPKKYIFAAFTIMHLAEWYDRTRYCGHCSSALVPSDRERAMVCPSCGAVFYPRINPAVIVGVKKGDELLLTKYNRGFSQYALIAGFVEIGETLEEAVRREVMEETGVTVKNIRYYKSQPWGMAGDLLTGFLCEAEGEGKIVRDESELKEARWVRRELIEEHTARYSLTSEIMSEFKKGNW